MEYQNIFKHYEQCLAKHGDSHLGVDWPIKQDALTRYQVMLDIIKYNCTVDVDSTLLDFGAGCGGLLDYIQDNSVNVKYSALDISSKFCSIIQDKHPDISVYHLDIIRSGTNKLPVFDYILFNGVFTEKRSLTDDQMWDFMTSVITAMFKHCKYGIAFNVMTNVVDYKEDHLFYLSVDKLTQFLKQNLSRKYVINQSYGLWEYTVYLYH